MALSRLFDLNIAAAQCATGHIAVAHEDREGVGVFTGLIVVTDVHLEAEAWGVVDLRVAQNPGAPAPFSERHGRHRGTLDGLSTIVVVIGDVSAWRPTRIRLGGH